MLFTVSAKNVDQSIDLYAISATSWSNCVSYIEDTGKEIQGINLLPIDNIILNNTSLNGMFQIILKDITTQETSNNFIYDTFENSSTWAQNQSNKEVVNVQYQKRSFIAI